MNTTDNPHCQRTQRLLPDWLTGGLSPTDRAAFEAHVAHCPGCQREAAAMEQLWQQLGTVPTPQPGPQVRTRFYALLDELAAEPEPATSRASAHGWRWPWVRWSPDLALRLAHGLLLVGAGVWAGVGWQQRRTPDVAYRQQIDTLSAQVREMRQMMLLALLENPSATERLRAVSYTKDIHKVGGQVIDALLTTLNNDPNVNVRLVTLEALADLAHDPRVREGLVQSLTRQESPLVQVALADVMLKLQEKRSLKPLQQLLRRKDTNELVKSKLQQTINELS